LSLSFAPYTVIVSRDVSWVATIHASERSLINRLPFTFPPNIQGKVRPSRCSLPFLSEHFIIDFLPVVESELFMISG
jgi:hypothetical protein